MCETPRELLTGIAGTGEGAGAETGARIVAVRRSRIHTLALALTLEPRRVSLSLSNNTLPTPNLP